jgi:hypothetical protein
MIVDDNRNRGADDGRRHIPRAGKAQGKAEHAGLELRVHVPHAGRQGEAMVAGEFLSDCAQL